MSKINSGGSGIQWDTALMIVLVLALILGALDFWKTPDAALAVGAIPRLSGQARSAGLPIATQSTEVLDRVQPLPVNTPIRPSKDTTPPPSKPHLKPSCNETDSSMSGPDYYQPGTTTVVSSANGYQPHKHQDQCSGNVLTEYYCSAGIVMNTIKVDCASTKQTSCKNSAKGGYCYCGVDSGNLNHKCQAGTTVSNCQKEGADLFIGSGQYLSVTPACCLIKPENTIICYFNGTQKPGKKPHLKPSCNETDSSMSGPDYYQPGTTTVVSSANGYQPHKHQDQCSGNVLTEYYCSAGIVMNTIKVDCASTKLTSCKHSAKGGYCYCGVDSGNLNHKCPAGTTVTSCQKQGVAVLMDSEKYLSVTPACCWIKLDGTLSCYFNGV